jgi:hypothetical protein
MREIVAMDGKALRRAIQQGWGQALNRPKP